MYVVRAASWLERLEVYLARIRTFLSSSIIESFTNLNDLINVLFAECFPDNYGFALWLKIRPSFQEANVWNEPLHQRDTPAR